jgi:hypothetical protein
MAAVRSGNVARSAEFEYVEETAMKEMGDVIVRSTPTVGGDGR